MIFFRLFTPLELDAGARTVGIVEGWAPSVSPFHNAGPH